MQKWLFILLVLELPQIAGASAKTCEKPDQMVQIRESYAKDWSTRFPDVLSMALMRVDTEPTSKNSVEYIELSNFVKRKDNPFIVMGLKEGDRIYGTENLTFNGKNDLQFYNEILTKHSHCLKVDRSNENIIIRYTLTSD